MASDINNVNLVGRLTRDAEVKYSTSGVAIARLSLANTQSRKQGEQWVEESHFFDLTMIGRRADALQRYLTKGTQIAVQGTLQQDRWQDKQTGQNRSKVVVLVNDIQLLGSRNSGGGQGGGQSQGGGNYGGGYGNGNANGGGNFGGGGNYSNNAPAPSDDGFDDDIPF
jgi:single-strand DNA-binding protein